MNLSIPTTTEEFKEVLVAMKNEYNIAPLTFDMYTPLIYPISAAFGIYSDWQEYEIDGKKEVRYYMEAPGYADYIDYMADLYKSGLIDAEISTQNLRTLFRNLPPARREPWLPPFGAFPLS